VADGRSLADAERATSRARLGAVVLDLEGTALLAWLTDPAARGPRTGRGGRSGAEQPDGGAGASGALYRFAR